MSKCSKCNVSIKQPYTKCYNCYTTESCMKLICSTCKKKTVKSPYKNCYDCFMKSRNSCGNCGTDSIFMTGRSGRDVCFDCFISEEQDY